MIGWLNVYGGTRPAYTTQGGSGRNATLIGRSLPPPPPSWGRTPKHRSCAVESLPKETSVVGKLSIPSRGETEEFSAPEKLGNSSVLDIG